MKKLIIALITIYLAFGIVFLPTNLANSIFDEVGDLDSAPRFV